MILNITRKGDTHLVEQVTTHLVSGRGLKLEVEMKKLLAVTAASLMIAGLTMSAASAKHRHHHRMHSMTTTGSSMKPGGMGGSNAELKGNSATSAGGSNSLANTNNPGGMGNNAGPPMK
jgi:hypothetical protein